MGRKKVYLLYASLLISVMIHAQVTAELRKSLQKMLADTTLKSATIGLLVIDAITNEIIIAQNESVGLAPASAQKIFTSIAGFELLGGSYRYETKLGYNGKIDNGVITGNLLVIGSGDPTLGSWRWRYTTPENRLSEWKDAIKKAGVKSIQGRVTCIPDKPYENGIPGGWIWDDVGNYYGAGSYFLNWKENQYDLVLQSDDRAGGPVKIIKSKPASVMNRSFRNELKSAEKGSGDNAYIYFPMVGNTYLLRGTIPVGEKEFIISGASNDPETDLITDLSTSIRIFMNNSTAVPYTTPVIFHTSYSPTFDSINYWFMKKSINLYGEAILKSIASVKKETGSTENGVSILQNFWLSKGIERSSLRLLDGSGLSPQNRVTVKALVQALQYAKKQTWFASFHSSLPVINNMTMKSGSIGGARSYAGYQRSKAGKQYIFAIIINNYSGSSGTVVTKMLTLLDLLK